MQPRNAERFPKVTAHEHAFLDAEVRADSQPPRLSIPERECLLDDFQLPPDYHALVAAATAWVSPLRVGPVARDVRSASAMISAIRRHLDALAAILDSLENDRQRYRSHERVATQVARVRALRAGGAR